MSGPNTRVLEKSIQNAWLTIMSSLTVRTFTFAINAYVLRHLDREILGLGVRLLLLFDTIAFLSREAFRKACLTRPDDGHWRGIINLTWMSVPLGGILSLMLGYVWIHHLEQPSEKFLVPYGYCVYLTCLSVIINLLSEPFFIIGQAYMHVKFRSGVDLFWGCAPPLFQGLIVSLVWRDEDVLLAIGITSVMISTIYCLSHVIYFHFVVRSQSQGSRADDSDRIPFASLRDFLPDLNHPQLDRSRLTLSLSFFKQGFFKQFLTEGEKYIFTWFSLMSIPEQGVYDVISNLGSIPARLFFVKLEDSAHLYFSQTVTRRAKVELPAEEAPSRHLHILLRSLILLGLVIVTFGVSYSHLALHIYGGTLLSDGLGPTLLQAHCVYIMFLALNGISECYAFNVMSSESLSKYNYWMAVMSGIFMFLAWGLATTFGPIGFVMANICNFSMRIAHNLYVIRGRHLGTSLNPLAGLRPNWKILGVLLTSGLACQYSERLLYGPSWRSSILHLLVGAILFVLSISVIIATEPGLRALLRSRFKRKQK
eukprot:maker-scaffold722_size106786-snap-gene-0.26 protein:Tk04286 transcript:maker-scaffold722_size106786-snap-gene-0.26-mRNA-1 annotation:"rft1-like protein"